MADGAPHCAQLARAGADLAHATAAPSTPIASGRSAEVRRLADGRVVKIFRAGVPVSMVEREHAAAALAARLGLPVAGPLERGTWDGRAAICYPCIDGPSLLQALQRAPHRVLPWMRTLAQLHAEMHRHDAAGALRSLNDVLATDIRHGPLQVADQERALALLGALPAGSRLCHGDLHPGNVLLGPQGPAIVDWSKAAAGAPEADVVRTELLLRFAPLAAGRPESVDTTGRRLAAWLYKRCYAQAAGLELRRLQAWYLPVAAAWMRAREGAPGDAMERWLQRLLARTVQE